MSRHSHLHLLRLTALLLFIAPQLSAISAPLKYLPDPTFSVLSRKGTPKDITHGGGKRIVDLTRANPA